MEAYITICEIDSQWEFAVCLGKLKQGLGINLEVGMGREMGERFKKEGIYVYLWLIHVEETAKFCKVIILHLGKKNKTVESYIFCRLHTHPTPPQDKEGS